jgi:hypothetical protein
MKEEMGENGRKKKRVTIKSSGSTEGNEKKTGNVRMT